MARLIYIDTNVYMDYFQNRSYGLRPAGEFAFILFQRAFSCEFRIVVSDKLFYELKKHAAKEAIQDLFNELKKLNKTIEVIITPEIKNFALKLSKSGSIHYSDALHYAIALNAGVEAIITNDREFRNLSSDKLKVLLPEEA